MPKGIPTGELLVRKIILRKQHTELSERMMPNGPFIAEHNTDIIEQRVNLKVELDLIDKELRRRGSIEQDS